MTVQIIKTQRPSGSASTHEGIVAYKWQNPDGVVGWYSKEDMVAWVQEGHVAYVQGPTRNVPTQVRERAGVAPFLQTVTDYLWSDNLLALPSVTVRD